MAVKGLSKFVVGKYASNGSAVTYSDATLVSKMIEYALTINASENNPLYADNMEAENDKGVFQNGDLTIGTDELSSEMSLLILGTKKASKTIGGKSFEENVYDDSRESPYLCTGFIELHQHNNVDKYRSIFLPKVFFNIPEYAATTKKESIEWQTPSITGKVCRSDEVNDDYNHPWMIDAYFDTELEALEYLMIKSGKTLTPAPAKAKVGS